ncbi:MAG: hypothetical protein AAF891_04125 [Pseudomonadota bacterium]
MTAVTITPGERGQLRVFALSLTQEDARTMAANKAASAAALLGVPQMDGDQVELFALSYLGELGLAGYLTEGYGIAPDVLASDRAKLAALDGWVLLVRSAAVAERPAHLQIAPDATLISTYAEPGVDWSEGQELTSAAATQPAPLKKRPSDAAMSGRIATYALIFLALFTAVFIWIAS